MFDGRPLLRSWYMSITARAVLCLLDKEVSGSSTACLLASEPIDAQVRYGSL
jgi:hypothetical protein